MEPISLILAALLAGVVKGAGESAANAVQDACGGLRDPVHKVIAVSTRLYGSPRWNQTTSLAIECVRPVGRA